jgi:hypothetical protein
MPRKRLASLALVIAAVAGVVAAVYAQVPPHQPGTVCITPKFWCWARPSGPPGGICYCPTAMGPVKGVLR